ncbi:MAG: SDR family oxidoreductase [bacterium]|nr:SDR family oxidoreductase [bacterium]
MNRLEGRRALVTGAASGIGRGTALRLAEEGAAVFCADIAAEGAQETAKQITTAGGTAAAGAVDVADAASCEAGVAAAVEALGGLDTLANVAGILRPGHTLEQDPAVWHATIGVNLTGTFQMCRAALAHLVDREDGPEGGCAIVNIASAAALQGVPYNAAYCASKAGVVGLTRSLASEYARRKVRVNAICPGGISTPMTAAGFPVDGIDPALFARVAPQMPMVGQPEDIAALVAYLASDEARYMTGSAITIDGGQLA